MNNVYLAHHGIKGQRWGVRRYQNSDGSLNKAGRRRLKREIRSNKSGKITNFIHDNVWNSNEGKILSLYDDGESGEAIPKYFREKAYGIGKPPKRYYDDWNKAYNNFINAQSQILRQTLGDLSDERINNGKTYLEYLSR